MVRIVLAVLLILLGAFPVLLHNDFSLSQLSPVELTVIAVCVIAAAALVFWRRKASSGQPSGVHTMSFVLEGITSFAEDSPSLHEGQQLYLRPYMGNDHEQIAVTDEKAEVFGYVPQEYQEYVLSRIEAHRLTHTVAEKLDAEHFGAYSVTVRITC